MTSPQQYTDTFKQTQDTMITAFDAWTKAFQQGLGQLPGAGAVDPDAGDRPGLRLRHHAAERSA